jgi:hypothetical protein
VSAIGVSIQFSETGNNTGTNWVQVNIPDKFFKVGIFLANNGFVTVLKQLSVTLVPEVKTHGIARKEPSHQRGKGSKSCLKQKMCMILDEYPCVTGCFSLGHEFCQALKVLPPDKNGPIKIK